MARRGRRGSPPAAPRLQPARDPAPWPARTTAGTGRGAKLDGREPLALHPADAEARGIGAGDPVRRVQRSGRVPRDRGGERRHPPGSGPASLPAHRYDPEARGTPGALCKHGNPNVLTPDRGTSKLAQGPIALTCLVEVERVRGHPPGGHRVRAARDRPVARRGVTEDRLQAAAAVTSACAGRPSIHSSPSPADGMRKGCACHGMAARTRRFLRSRRERIEPEPHLAGVDDGDYDEIHHGERESRPENAGE